MIQGTRTMQAFIRRLCNQKSGRNLLTTLPYQFKQSSDFSARKNVACLQQIYHQKAHLRPLTTFASPKQYFEINQSTCTKMIDNISTHIFNVIVGKGANTEKMAKIPHHVWQVILGHDASAEMVAQIPNHIWRTIIVKGVKPNTVSNIPQHILRIVIQGSSPEAVAQIPPHIKRIVIGPASTATAISQIPIHVRQVILGKGVNSNLIAAIPKHVNFVQVSDTPRGSSPILKLPKGSAFC